MLTISQAPSRARGQSGSGVRRLAQVAEAGSGTKWLISQCGAGAPRGYRLRAACRTPAGSVGVQSRSCKGHLHLAYTGGGPDPAAGRGRGSLGSVRERGWEGGFGG